MLDRDEEQALAAIEARLHAEDPDFAEALDAGVVRLGLHPAVRTLLVALAAVAVTTAATLALGPNLGALVAVLSLAYAFLYGWQALRVCPGISAAPPTRPPTR
jgi:hypothetical protein